MSNETKRHIKKKPRIYMPLTERFRVAYFNIPHQHRSEAKEIFMQAMRIGAGTLKQKIAGNNVVTLQEVEYLEAYRPDFKSELSK